MRRSAVVEDLGTLTTDLALAQSAAKAHAFLTEIRPLFVFAHAADHTCGELQGEHRRNAEINHLPRTVPVVVQDYVRPFTRVLDLHVGLYDGLPINLLRQLGLLKSAEEVDAEKERRVYVIKFFSRVDTRHD
jgi:hypothetical protein